MLSILIVNGDRYLINEDSKSVDETCSTICSSYPDDATIEFDTVQPIDLSKKLIKKSNGYK